MIRTLPTLVYVHGAGVQPHEADWLRLHDEVLFEGRPWAPTDLAYYADLVEASEGHGDAAGDHPTESPVHHSIRDTPGEGEAHRFLLHLAGAMGPADHRSPFAFTGHGIPPGVREFYRGVSGYLHGEPDLSDGIRERVRVAIRRNPGPVVVLAHSLGSVIAFDVLGEAEFARGAITLITVGTALGLGPAQERLQAWRSSRPIEVPVGVARWRNFHAAGDVVAMGSGLDDLRNDYSPTSRIHSTQVRNEAEWHHAFDGYLATPEVRDAVYAHLAVHPGGSDDAGAIAGG